MLKEKHKPSEEGSKALSDHTTTSDSDSSWKKGPNPSKSPSSSIVVKVGLKDVQYMVLCQIL